MRIAIYARVSTDDKNQDPEMQLAPLREAAESMGELVGEYVDHAPARDFLRRRRWRDCLGEAHRGKFDLLMVWKLDRAFRSVLDAAVTLERLRSYHVSFRSLTEPYLDTSSPVGEVLFYVTAAYAQLERAMIAERVKAGMEWAQKQGKEIGRPGVSEKVDLQLACRLRSEGKSWREIAEEHPSVKSGKARRRKPSASSIRRAVQACQNGGQEIAS